MAGLAKGRTTGSGGTHSGWARVRGGARASSGWKPVQHSVLLMRSANDVEDALRGGPAGWFPALTDENIGSVGIRVAGVTIRKRVVIEIGQPFRTTSWAVFPVSWKATFPQRLFPVMTGRVEMRPLDGGGTRLTVSGTYQPPLGSIGRQLDGALMHAVAKATVQELAESIAARLEKSIAARRTPGV